MSLNSKWETKYKWDICLMIPVILLPFIIYIHLLFSREKNFIQFFNFTYYHGFINNEIFIWSLLNFLIPLGLLTIMYLTVINRWKYFLIPLICLYIIGFLTTLNYFTSIQNGINSKMGILILFLAVFLLVFADKTLFKTYRRRFFSLPIKSFFDPGIKNHFDVISEKLSIIRKERNNYTTQQYLKNIYNIKLRLFYEIKKYGNVKAIKSQSKFNEFIIAIILIMAIIIWFIPYYVPNGLQYLNIGGYTIKSYGFNDVSLYIWFISRKLIVLIFLTVWYLTSPHWWKFAILSPIILYGYQFWEAAQDISYIDSQGNINVFPIIVLVIFILMSLSKMMKFRAHMFDYHDELIEEIEEVIGSLINDEVSMKEFYKKYEKIKGNILYANNSNKQYLKILMNFENEIDEQLNLKNNF